MSPMSSTAGGGGGGAGGTGFAGFRVVVTGFGLGFELPAGFLVVVAGLAGVGVWAIDAGASRHAAARAAARFEAREVRASMAADSTRDAALRVDNQD